MLAVLVVEEVVGVALLVRLAEDVVKDDEVDVDADDVVDDELEVVELEVEVEDDVVGIEDVVEAVVEEDEEDEDEDVVIGAEEVVLDEELDVDELDDDDDVVVSMEEVVLDEELDVDELVNELVVLAKKKADDVVGLGRMLVVVALLLTRSTSFCIPLLCSSLTTGFTVVHACGTSKGEAAVARGSCPTCRGLIARPIRVGG